MSDEMQIDVVPPGEFLKDELEERGWTQTEFAEIIGRKPRVVNEIILGKRAITPETAQEIAAALGTTAQLWMNLEVCIPALEGGPEGRADIARGYAADPLSGSRDDQAWLDHAIESI